MTTLTATERQRMEAVDARHLTCQHPTGRTDVVRDRPRTFAARLCRHCNSYQVVMIDGHAVAEPWRWDETCRLLKDAACG